MPASVRINVEYYEIESSTMQYEILLVLDPAIENLAENTL
jgi:hypothetical protein